MGYLKKKINQSKISNLKQILLFFVSFLILGIQSVKAQANFFGTRHNVTIGSYNGFCDEPPVGLPDGSKPWVWYGPTINGYPNASTVWLFEQLIKKGFWVCGLDVGESYGAPYGTNAFNQFYNKVTADYKLNEKVILIPQSRGGLMLYNWAANGNNAGKITRIAGIYTVGDIRSYPGIAQAAPAYQMTVQKLTEDLSKYNPVDNLKPIVDAGIKVLHIHGDADAVVPIEANSQAVHDEIKALGGDMTLIKVPGKGHAEIPEFFERAEVLNFILDDLKEKNPVLPSKHVSLFNGTDLSGWHTQGNCPWTVEKDYIKGIGPDGEWCHLVTDEQYSDFYLTLKYYIIRGNSGVYVRSAKENSQCCGIQGIQIDFGPSQDGSVMPVVDGNWFWTELTTKAVDENLVDYTKWNEISVQVSGDSIKTWVNGHLMVSIDYEKNMFPMGNIALQLHGGSVGDEIHYKEIELYQPRKIEGCMDTTYQEFSASANFSNPSMCQTRVVQSVFPPGKIRKTFRRDGTDFIFEEPLEYYPEVFDLKGRPLEINRIDYNRFRLEVGTGVYFVKLGERQIKILMIP